MPAATLVELDIADEPGTWAALGFAVEDDGMCRIGGVRIRLAGEDTGKGIVSWTLRNLASEELDGLPTVRADEEAAADGATAEHPNGIVVIDHVVAVSPQLDRTVAALQQAGLDLRRIREEPTPAGAPRQAFFRVGEAILEVIQEPEEVVERHGGPARPAFFWGLAFVAEDLDQAVARLGEHAGAIRPAVQPGRRIAPLRRSAGLAISVALMSPRPPSKV